MRTIESGEYNGVHYGVMYDDNDIIYHADRYDKENRLIGMVGWEQYMVNGEWVNSKPAMLWLKDEEGYPFVKGERYFTLVDKTVSELVDFYKDYITDITVQSMNKEDEHYTATLTDSFAKKIGAQEKTVLIYMGGTLYMPIINGVSPELIQARQDICLDLAPLQWTLYNVPVFINDEQIQTYLQEMNALIKYTGRTLTDDARIEDFKARLRAKGYRDKEEQN